MKHNQSFWRKRWVQWAAGGVVVFAVLFIGVYVWAYRSLDTSTLARALIWRSADIGDQFKFPSRQIPADKKDPSPLPVSSNSNLADTKFNVNGQAMTLGELAGQTNTRNLLIVHDNKLIYEQYLGGAKRNDLQTSFSVAKSFLSILIGIAVDEGKIKSVDDPVTDYIPELAGRDAGFSQITLRDLLTMSSGIRYWDTDLPWPFADDTLTYYGVNLRDVALRNTRIEQPPGQEWHYNNFHPLLLGLVLERVTGMNVSDYMSVKLWRPLGAEFNATWNIDSRQSGFEKLESGLNVAPVDYARFGLMMMHGGKMSGRQIVSEHWVSEATANDQKTNPADFYQYFWWIDTQRQGRFYAQGNLGQFIYIAPDADVVIVRNGSDWGMRYDAWIETFRQISDHLSQ